MKLKVPIYLIILILISCTPQPSESAFQTSIAQTVNARLAESTPLEINESQSPLPTEENEPANEVNILTFKAHQTEIQQDQCTILEWNIEGGYGVELDGQLVDWIDDREVCPEETTTYWLKVDGGDRLVEENVTIQVYESSKDEVDTSPESTQQSFPQGAAPTSKPPTSTPGPTNCYKTSNEYITDLAITDIYPGNMPKGQFWVRITNNGPVACNNVSFKFLGCSVDSTPKSDAWIIPPVGETVSGTINTDPNINIIPGYVFPSGLQKVSTTLNIKPGETQEIPTGIGFDTDLANYRVTCHFSAESGYSDLNNSNQYYQENIPLPQ